MKSQKELIESRTDKELLKDWQEIDKLPVTDHIATVRGWLMDEIQKRWSEEFDRWIENSDVDDRLESYIKL